MKKRKKIFYVGGMISLIFVPLLFWYYANTTLQKMNLRVLDIGLPFKEKYGETLSEQIKIPIVGWNYKTVNVKTNFNKHSESYYISLIENLKKENIEKTGIKFQLSNENTYKDVVGLINILQKTNFETYDVDTENENSIYALYFKPELDKSLSLSNDNVILNYNNQNEYDYQHANFWQKLIQFSPRGIYFIIFGFLILVYTSILKPKITIKI